VHDFSKNPESKEDRSAPRALTNPALSFLADSKISRRAEPFARFVICDTRVCDKNWCEIPLRKVG